LVANAFIAAFDQHYGLGIPLVDVHSIFVNDPYSAANFSTINPGSSLRAAP
jgi:hypothetical protein